MNFSNNFRLQARTLQPYAKNRLVGGLLEISSQEQFNLPDFTGIITELKEEYETTSTKLNNLKTDISEQVVKDVLGAKIASENLFDYVCDKFATLWTTNHMIQDALNLENTILANLKYLVTYSNDIIFQEQYLEGLLRNRSFTEKIRDNTVIRKILFTLTLLTLFKGQQLKKFDADLYAKSYPIVNTTPAPLPELVLKTATLDTPKITNIINTISIPSNVITKRHVRALAWVESNDSATIVSPVGARGVMQLMKDTWKDFGKGSYRRNVFDVKKNIEAGIRNLIWIENYCKDKHPNWNKLSNSEKSDIILAAYNCGAKKLRDHNWNINFNDETSSHIRKIHAVMGQV